MDQPEVPRKRNYPKWLWLIPGVVIMAILLSMFIRNHLENPVTLSSPIDTPTFAADHTQVAYDWNSVIFTVPKVEYNEVPDKGIKVRGNEEYTIYSIDEDVLFDRGKPEIRSQAIPKLQQVANSAAKRFKGHEMRIFVYADSSNSPIENFQLAEKRSGSLLNWMIKNGKIDSNRVSVHPVKAAQQATPDKANSEEYKQVKIVVRKKEEHES